MIPPKTAQVIKYCGLFLILLIFLPFDLAVTVTVSFYLALNSRNYAKLVIVSLIIFLADIIFRNFDISIRFISDLALDSYILLLSSLFIYLKSQQRIVEYFQKLGSSSRKVLSINTLKMIGISSIFSLLLAPIVGIPFAVISGYISFSYLSKHFEGRYAYMAGLFFLFFSPFFIIAKRDDISENFAIISFYFLIIGTIQELIKLIREKKQGFLKESKTEVNPEKTAEDLSPADLSMHISYMKFPKLKLPEFNPKIIIGIFTFIISFALIYILIRNIKLPQISFLTKPITPTAMPTVIPTSTVTPTAVPTAAPIPAAESGKLKILLQNGTEILGLAASASAKLKKSGFTNVSVGNATSQDYSNWEVNLKNKDTELIENLKNILELEILNLKEASMPAEIDILIIAGKNK